MFSLETTLTGTALNNLIAVLSAGYQVNTIDSVGFTQIQCSELVPTAKMTVKQLAAIAANKGIKLPPRSKKADYLTALGVDTESVDSVESKPKKQAVKVEEPAELIEGNYIAVPIKELKPILNEVKKFVPKRWAHPVLQYVKLVAKSGFARIHSTDLNTFYECDLPATCTGDWGALVSPAELESLCKGKGFVYITPAVIWNTAGVRIEYLVNENPDEYPAAPTNGGEVIIVTNEIFKQGAFAHLVKSKDETKAVLNGVNYQIANGICEIASTNGHRLYTHTVSVSSEVSTNFTIKTDLSVIDWQGDLLISKCEGYVTILDDSGRAITTRNLESNSPYPNVKIFTPVTFTGESVINCKEFVETVKQLYIAAGKENDIVQLSFKKDSQQLILGISKDPRNHYSADMVTTAIDCCVTEDVAFNLNVNYLKDLPKLESGEVSITKAVLYGDGKGYDEGSSPFILKTGNSMYLLMSVQIKK